MKRPNTSVENRGYSMEKPRPETWAASAIDIYSNDEVRKRQFNLSRILEERAEQASDSLGLSDDLRDFIVTSTIQRFHHENGLNYHNYENRLYDVPKDHATMPIDFLGSYTRAMEGTATPKDLLQVRHSLGMPSIELAKLSHIGGIGINELDTMRASAIDAVVSQDGLLYDDSDPKLSLINNDALVFAPGEKSPLNAMVMTRKRYIGELPDGTSVREKSQFVLRIDPGSSFDQQISTKIRSIEIKNGEHWRDKIMEIPGFEEAVFEALESDEYSAAIPLVTTIYAHNDETVKDIERLRRESRKRGVEAIGQRASSIVFIRDTDGEVRSEALK